MSVTFILKFFALLLDISILEISLILTFILLISLKALAKVFNLPSINPTTYAFLSILGIILSLISKNPI